MALIFCNCLNLDVAFAGCNYSWVHKECSVYTDASLKQSVMKGLREAGATYNNISVEVRDNKARLFGNLSTSLQRIEASKITWDVRGILAVDNQIKVAEYGKKYVEAEWVSSNARLLVRLKKGDVVDRFSFESTRGVLYVMGRANSDEERNKIINLVVKAFSDKKVQDYIHVDDC
ncbi:BON domain-containing protein [Anaplasmataceae bacterium AB001_6]|nr:BON domain-containing protein [Anaplasmataceae bacterium AB001_6]